MLMLMHASMQALAYALHALHMQAQAAWQHGFHYHLSLFF
jgi:hypothetical protein